MNHLAFPSFGIIRCMVLIAFDYLGIAMGLDERYLTCRRTLFNAT